MAGATPKVIDVGQRIEFFAEIAAGAGHARDAAVESVKQHRKANRFGRVVEMPVLGGRGVHDLQDGVVAQRHICGGKQRGENVHPFADVGAAAGSRA